MVGMHTVIILFSVSFISATEESAKVCVIPTENSTCSCTVPCHTFDYYVSNPGSELYKSPLLTVEFLPGTHIVKEAFSSVNHTGLYLVGSDAIVEIEPIDNTSWFSLNKSSNISFTNLSFELIDRSTTSRCETNYYIFHFESVSNLVFSHVNLTNPCGGGAYLLSTIEIKFAFVNFDTWLHGLNMFNVCSINYILHCVFNGRMNHSLITVQYSQLTSDASLDVHYCEFYNGSGSLDLDTGSYGYTARLGSKFSLSITHTTFITPAGGDITAHIGFSNNIYVDISLDNVHLLKGTGYGIFLNFGIFNGRYDVRISNCSIFFHNESAIRVYSGGNPESMVSITNTVIENNQASPFSYPISGLLMKGSIDPSFDPVTVIKNVTFNSNHYVASTSVDTVVTMMLYFVHHITLTDCYFINNTGTALYLENSTIAANGTLNFVSNTAYNGAAIYISGPSTICVNFNSVLLFRKNHAIRNGGAIYIDYGNIMNQVIYTLDNGFIINAKPCFITFTENEHTPSDTYLLHFEGNFANDGGNDIFGGNLDQIHVGNKKCIALIYEISAINLSSMSAIASSSSRVCLCYNHSSEANCLKYITNVYIYPGQTFKVSAFTVGQHFGTSRGPVYVQIMNKSSGSSLPNEQKVQGVDIRNCSDSNNVLKYNVELATFKEKETIILTTQDVVLLDYVDKNAIDKATEEYKDANESYIPPLLLDLPVYIVVHFSKCPNGFDFIESVCNCTHVFQRHSGRYSVLCDIDTQEITREYSVWVNASNTTARYSQYCPLLYCNSSVVQVNLSREHGADVQCIDHHSGVLCGGCQKGFSLAIGSSNCLPHCSNNYLWLLLVFAIAGVVLVLLIKFLNLTITQGMISGLIFYGNIVQSNKNALLNSSDPGVRVFATFIAWLNLDFGIETCFSEGLDMYTKTWLQFVFPLYLWILAGGVILVCRYSRLATKFFGDNTVHVLATIFLLSYNKLLITITMVYSSSTINVQNNYNESDDIKEDVVWTYDGNIHFFSTRHSLLFAVSTGVLLFLWLPFTLCVLLGQWLQRYNHYRGLRWLARITPLLDAYYGPLKDSRRYWVGVLLLARLVVIVPAADPLAPASAAMLAIIILCSVLLLLNVWLGRVYKKLYLTILESTLITNLGVFAALSFYLDAANGPQRMAVYIMVGMVFIAFVCIVGYQLVHYLRKSFLKKNYYTNLQYSPEEDVDEH